MSMPPYRPERILLERAVARSPVTKTVLSQLPGVPVERVDSSHDVLERSRLAQPSIARGKRWLVLARHQGRFFKPCPAGETRGDERNACCNYWVINYSSNCHMECSYCYLQSYLNFPHMVVYANVDDLLEELGEALDSDPEGLYRIGTGELADSLALDDLTGYSEHLVPFFAGRANAVLEFKTKSDCIARLPGLSHGGRTVVSWSINPRRIQHLEEHKTATIEQRLTAAERCAADGYLIAFHIDPLVHYPEWEHDYRELVREVFDRLHTRISWVSLGALRLHPGLLDQIRERFPNSPLPLAEWVRSADGKFRYFKPIRVEMYQKVSGWIRKYGGQTPQYTCMERNDVWRRVFGDQHAGDVAVGDQLVQMVL